MDELLATLVTSMMAGGPQAIIAILLVVIGCLWIERSRLLRQINHTDHRIDKILDDYAHGNVVLGDALHDLKYALLEIKSKF